MIFLIRRLAGASTKPDFCFFLTLIAKNTVYLGDGDVRLQLVVSFSNLGLRLTEKLLKPRLIFSRINGPIDQTEPQERMIYQ